MPAHIQPLRPDCEPEPRSPVRERLAAAIARVAAARAEVARVEQAAQVLSRQRREDLRRIDDLEAEFDQVRKAEPERVVAQLLNEAGPRGRSVAQVQDELAQERAALENRREATALIGERSREAGAELSLALAERDRAREALGASSPEVMAVFGQFDVTRARLADLTNAMRLLEQNGMLPPVARWWEAANRPLSPIEGSLLPAWEAAIKSLETDAGAALPGDGEPAAVA